MRALVIKEGQIVKGHGLFIRHGALTPLRERIPIVFNFNQDYRAGWATNMERSEEGDISFEMEFFNDYHCRLVEEMVYYNSGMYEFSIMAVQLVIEQVPAVDWINDENKPELVSGKIAEVAFIPNGGFPKGANNITTRI